VVFEAHGLQNFLWFCDVANFVLLIGLWVESPLLISSQAVGVLLVQLFWALDFGLRLLTGDHPLGATAYMFDESRPLLLRAFSLYHLLVPAVLVWALVRLGYHRRGWLVQTALCWVVLPLTYAFAAPERNVNWLWRPFGIEQTWMAPGLFFWVCFFAYPLVLFLPTHWLLMAWARRSRAVDLLA
jgi:hypothetical protein